MSEPLFMKKDIGKSAVSTRKGVRFLFAGLAAVIPVLGTVWLLVALYQVLIQVGDKMVAYLLDGLNFFRSGVDITIEDVAFPGFNVVRFLMPVFLLFLIGFMVTNKPGKKVLSWMDEVMKRIPYLGFIYTTLKQFVDALKNLGVEKKFKSVAYVEYPSPGCRMIGFVTGCYYDTQVEKNVTTVFVPTSPNPMTGFVIIIDDNKVEHSDMSLEEASKMILSAGLLAPSFR